MLQVCVIISGALVTFIVLIFWASSGRFKSNSETEHG
jgi:hypothetical protein